MTSAMGRCVWLVGAVFVGILAALAIWPGLARASPADVCSPDAPCQPLVIHLSPNVELMAAAGDLVFGQVKGLGDTPTQWVVLRAQGDGFAQIGSLPLSVRTVHGAAVQGSFVYLYGEDSVVSAVSVADPSRPTLTDRIHTGERIDAIAAAPGALYVFASNVPTGSASALDLHVLDLSDPAEPALARSLAAIGGQRPQVLGDLMAVVTETGARLYSLSDPLAPTVTATLTTVYTDSVAPPQDVLLVDGFMYLLRDNTGTGAYCRVVDIRDPSNPLLGGACPFLPFRTAIAGTFAYVDPNDGPSQYLDYQVYSLDDPARPVFAGTASQRFRTLHQSGGELFASVPGDPPAGVSVARLLQSPDGSLTEVGRSWRPSDLADPDSIVLVDGDRIYVDAGAGPGGRRIRMVDIRARAGPEIVGEFEAPTANPDAITTSGSLLATRTASRISLFDVRGPKTAVALGTVAPPAGESFAGMAFGGPGQMFAATTHNHLLSLDIRVPLTPTLVAQIDLPGVFGHFANCNGHLYLFEEGRLSIIDARNRGFALVRSIPIEAGVTAVAAWRNQIFIHRATAETLEILDCTTPASPAVRPFNIGAPDGTSLMRLAAVRNGRLALLFRTDGSVGQDVEHEADDGRFLLRLYTLDENEPTQIGEIARLSSSELHTDGYTIVGPDMQVVRPDGARLVSSQIGVEDSFQPRGGITYTLAAGPSGGGCLIHTERVPDSLPFDLDHGYMAGLYDVDLIPCGDEVHVAQSVEFTTSVMASVTVSITGQGAAIFLDRGDHWAPAHAAPQTDSARITAELRLPARWAVLGPPWPPVHLPYVMRTE